jgi:hypothetical protein
MEEETYEIEEEDEDVVDDRQGDAEPETQGEVF